MTTKFRVAICGGGIGGLTVAAVMSQARNANLAIDIYEMKDTARSVGAGIAVWKRTWQVFQELGFEKDCEDRGVPLPKEGESRGPMFRKGDEPQGGRDFLSQKLPYGPMTLPRPALLDILLSKLDPVTSTVHTSKKLLSYTEESGGIVKLVFEDGSISTANVLIGGDGVHSSIRGTMYAGETHADCKWSGQIAYRVQCPKSMIVDKYPGHDALKDPKIWCGKDRHVVTFPGKDTFSFTCFNTTPGGEGTIYKGPSVDEVDPAEVVAFFKDWEPDLQNIMKLITNRPSRWAIQVVPDLPHFVKGRVALLGDAAHAMLPHQGVGGGQSAEDAFVLGQLLAHPLTTKANIPEVLKIYEKIRMPFAQHVAWKSKENGLIYDFVHPDLGDAPELDKVADAISQSFIWLGQGGCIEEWEKAKALLESLPQTA